MRPPDWLHHAFVQHHWQTLTGYRSRVKVLGLLPSFQENVRTLDGLRKQLACNVLPWEPPYEKRYPYLDRDLLEFTYAIPREQLVRPTQRRSLMRRALVGIVPDEILNRKTKAFVARAPLVKISEDWEHLVDTTQNMVSSSLGIVDPRALLEALQRARHGEDVSTLILARTMCIESWFRDLRVLGYVKPGTNTKPELAWQISVKS
jgi:asparagine synthase (glutamine-hydrolysing)